MPLRTPCHRIHPCEVAVCDVQTPSLRGLSERCRNRPKKELLTLPFKTPFQVVFEEYLCPNQVGDDISGDFGSRCIPVVPCVALKQVSFSQGEAADAKQQEEQQL